MPRAYYSLPDGARFARALRESEITEQGCWIWPKFVGEDGYGKFVWHGRARPAHRVSAACFLGFDIESDLHVCHACDVRACVNPAHLWVGTNDDNMRDRDLKGRVHYGEQVHCAKLTTADAVAIREAYAAGVNQRDLAAQYGVWRQTISYCIRGDTWKRAGGPINREGLRGRRPAAS